MRYGPASTEMSVTPLADCSVFCFVLFLPELSGALMSQMICGRLGNTNSWPLFCYLSVPVSGFATECFHLESLLQGSDWSSR